jgi:hypothetical protein
MPPVSSVTAETVPRVEATAEVRSSASAVASTAAGTSGAAHDAHQRHGGEHAPPWNPLPPPTGPRPGHNPAEARAAPEPRCRLPTSDGAGCRRSSSSHTTRANPATVTPYGSATTLRRPPGGGLSTCEPDEASGWATRAPTKPTPGQSDRDDYAHPVPTATRLKRRLAGHSLVAFASPAQCIPHFRATARPEVAAVGRAATVRSE